MFEYKMALEEYNAQAGQTRQHRSRGKYAKGSIMQMFEEPWSGAQKLEDGSVYLEFDVKEVKNAQAFREEALK